MNEQAKKDKKTMKPDMENPLSLDWKCPLCKGRGAIMKWVECPSLGLGTKVQTPTVCPVCLMRERLNKAETWAVRVRELEDALELERMRLAACGVAAMANTEKTLAERLQKDNPYYSASYGDVCAAVDREMSYRTALAMKKSPQND